MVSDLAHTAPTFSGDIETRKTTASISDIVNEYGSFAPTVAWNMMPKHDKKRNSAGEPKRRRSNDSSSEEADLDGRPQTIPCTPIHGCVWGRFKLRRHDELSQSLGQITAMMIQVSDRKTKEQAEGLMARHIENFQTQITAHFPKGKSLSDLQCENNNMGLWAYPCHAKIILNEKVKHQ